MANKVEAFVARLREVHEQTRMVGWDFSKLSDRMAADEPWWDFEADCRAALAGAQRILDLGTGGGERLLKLLGDTDAPDKIITATEGWAPNVEVARTALAPYGIEVKNYDPDGGQRLPLPDESIDLVMARHEAINAAEVARVLAPGGRLLTQQVDGRDAEEIHAWFDEPFLYPNVTSRDYAHALEAAGLSVDVTDDWRGTMEYADAKALVSYLALVPWDAPNFTVEAHAPRLLELEARRPIQVTQRRFRLYATKDAQH
ncbi:MAG: methyltransferase domain-containing protein [Propionibacteriaceae bacterium]|nr:methyltransferase domain-containing protein [Propionibacteriaceae bacterium]